MYSGVSKQIIEKWLEMLVNNEEVDQKFVALIEELKSNDNLRNTSDLETVITKLEQLYENQNQTT